MYIVHIGLYWFVCKKKIMMIIIMIKIITIRIIIIIIIIITTIRSIIMIQGCLAVCIYCFNN